MAIGRNFEEAFLKAWASLEQGYAHPRPLTRADESEGEGMAERAMTALPDSTLVEWCRVATDRRMGALIEAFRRGWSVEKVHEITRITRWFLYRFEHIAQIVKESHVLVLVGGFLKRIRELRGRSITGPRYRSQSKLFQDYC